MFSYQMIQEIPLCKDAGYIELIEKGFSKDIKVLVYTKEGNRVLIRIATEDFSHQALEEFAFLKRCEPLNLRIPKPLDFGYIDNGRFVYRVYTWMDGLDLRAILKSCLTSEQIQLGWDSGCILHDIHAIPVETEPLPWELRYLKKIERNLKAYDLCAIKYPEDASLLQTIEQLKPLLKDRPCVYQHGDFHIGNMIYGEDTKVSIIDFNRPDVGDPWEEFNRIIWNVEVSPHFASAQLHGYFKGNPPLEFFKLLKLYAYVNIVASLPWSIEFGTEEIEIMMDNYRNTLGWYTHDAWIPHWYSPYELQKKGT